MPDISLIGEFIGPICVYCATIRRQRRLQLTLASRPRLLPSNHPSQGLHSQLAWFWLRSQRVWENWTTADELTIILKSTTANWLHNEIHIHVCERRNVTCSYLLTLCSTGSPAFRSLTRRHLDVPGCYRLGGRSPPSVVVVTDGQLTLASGARSS